jgi:formamidopyrimidine-DNA glycosylase
MPELPEVETMRRGIAGCVGCRIEAIERPRCRLKPIAIGPSPARLRRRVIGCTIDAVDRVGKRVLVQLSSDDVLVFEPRMTGLVLVAEPPNREHLRLRIALAGGSRSSGAASNGARRGSPSQLLYWDRRGLGSVRLLSPLELDEMRAQFGPDALAITADEFREQMGSSRREIKVALLDQHAVAGIGNLYASEILHVAHIHPQTPCDRLRKSAWRRIEQATHEILNEAIRYEGSTLGDGTYRNALNQQGGYQNHHRVYDREGQPCCACGKSRICRIVQAQRSTFYCPKCQRGRAWGMPNS